MPGNRKKRRQMQSGGESTDAEVFWLACKYVWRVSFCCGCTVDIVIAKRMLRTGFGIAWVVFCVISLPKWNCSGVWSRTLLTMNNCKKYVYQV